jgi:Spy/CpxP family protein refolding chaperone
MKYRCLFPRRAAVLALLVTVVAAPAAAQGKWWQSERFQKKLELTEDQVSRIEEVFQSAIPKLREQKKALDRLETQLSRLIDTSADEAAVMQEVDRVETARSELSKARTRMLLRMRRVLTADQRVMLGALHEEWERERKRDDHRNNRK